MTMRGGWPPSGFGERLRAERERAGLSRRELAERAKTHHNTIAKMEQGAQEPAWPLVLALARALGVKVTAFDPAEPERPGPVYCEVRPAATGQQPPKTASYTVLHVEPKPAVQEPAEGPASGPADQEGPRAKKRAQRPAKGLRGASNRQASSKRKTR